MATMAQMIAQDPEPDPDGSPGGRRLTPRVAPARRLSIADHDLRQGRQSRAKTVHGLKEPWLVDRDNPGTRAVVVRPAHEPEPEVMKCRAEALEKSPGRL